MATYRYRKYVLVLTMLLSDIAGLTIDRLGASDGLRARTRSALGPQPLAQGETGGVRATQRSTARVQPGQVAAVPRLADRPGK